MTSQQQPRMFHVKHIDFERSKTWLLRNMSCLQLFSPHEMPAHLRAFRYITQSRSAQHRPLQSPHKLSPRRLEWSFVLIERKLDGRITRQYTPSTSLNLFIDKASSETTSQHTHAERLALLRTHIPQHPYFCRQQIHSRKQNRRSIENRAALFCRTASKIVKTLDKH